MDWYSGVRIKPLVLNKIDKNIIKADITAKLLAIDRTLSLGNKEYVS